MNRSQAFAEYFRLLALEEGGVVLPDLSIDVVGQVVADMQESVEEYLKRFGLEEAWAGGARALVEDGIATAPSASSPEDVRKALFQAFVFRLMKDLHGVDLGDFHHVPEIPAAVGGFRVGIEAMLAEPLGETAAVIRRAMGIA